MSTEAAYRQAPLRDGQYLAELEDLQIVTDPRNAERRHVVWRLCVVEGLDAGRAVIKTTPAWTPEHLRWLQRDLRIVGVRAADLPRELADVEAALGHVLAGGAGLVGAMARDRLRIALATKGQARRVYLLGRVAPVVPSRAGARSVRAWSAPRRTGGTSASARAAAARGPVVTRAAARGRR